MGESVPYSLLYLVRHAATANNLASPPRLQGRRLDPPLSEEGRRQAEAAAQALLQAPIDAVYSSPLRRAMETAEAIARPSGLSVTPLEALIECDIGQWEGLSWPEIEARFPEEHRLFTLDAGTHPYAGGENLSQVVARVAPVLDGLLSGGRAGEAGRAIAVVAHNVVNRAYLAVHLDIPLSQARGIPQENTGINVLRCQDGQIRVWTVNSALHLAAPTRSTSTGERGTLAP